LGLRYKMGEKTVIFLDTNKIRMNLEWENDFSNLSPKGDFLKIIDYVEANNLQEDVLVVLPEIVLEEFYKSKKENFVRSLQSLKSRLLPFEHLSCCDFSNLKLPEETYDYHAYVSERIKELTDTKKYVRIISMDLEKSTAILKDLKDRVLLKKKPFRAYKDVSDVGFKDALIWITILHNPYVEQTDNFFFLTENKSDFNDDSLKKEFEDKHKKNIEIVTVTADLLKMLSEHYLLYKEYPELLKYIKTDYFKDALKDFLSTNQDFDKESLEIITDSVRIEEITEEELQSSPSLASVVDDIEDCKYIFVKFNEKEEQYVAIVIFDITVNEIIDVNVTRDDEIG